MDVTESIDHAKYLRETIELARKSPPKPTNFRVGCVIATFKQNQPAILSTGYTLELPGNTHAEQCALSKLAQQSNISEDDLSAALTPAASAILYTSLEPCGKRLSGNLPCVQRIIATRKNNPQGGIRKVVFGAKEPGTFVSDSQSCRLLTEAGIDWAYMPDFESEILSVATAGHEKVASTSAPPPSENVQGHVQETPRQAEPPRNPKKRMMEAPPGSDESWR